MTVSEPADTAAPLYAQQVRIAAPPGVVFELLVDAEQMSRWMGLRNELSAEPGGRLRIEINGRDVAAGHYVTVERPTRVVFTWGWEASAEMPPGSSTVEIALEPEGDGTLLTLAHHDCPPAMLDAHATGWGHYLDRLAVAATGDAGPDPWATPPQEDSA
jgi:uncharacterized protein YndB with AHSA1/START domain